jgi:hypothetical protein
LYFNKLKIAIETFERVIANVETLIENPSNTEDFTGAPNEFIDELTCDIMRVMLVDKLKDPVILPSKNICDMSTAKRAAMEYCKL